MTWFEIEQRSNNKHHPINVGSLSKPARDRFVELELDAGADSVFSLRLSGAERLFGIRDRWIFYLLWWDPEHLVCPAPLKYT
jgi:hypothetical protein